jgi:hypothetical protein
MAKLLFTPLSIVSGIFASLIGKKLFARVWAFVDKEDPPQADQRGAPWPKLVIALAIEGAVFRMVKGVVNHAARGWFAGLTGSWPGTDTSRHAGE